MQFGDLPACSRNRLDDCRPSISSRTNLPDAETFTKAQHNTSVAARNQTGPPLNMPTGRVQLDAARLTRAAIDHTDINAMFLDFLRLQCCDSLQAQARTPKHHGM